MKKIIMATVCLLSSLGLNACSTTNESSNGSVTNVPTQAERNVAASKINVELGLAYIQRNQLPRAKKKLLLALKQNPNSPTALDGMAYYWEVTGSNKLANNYYQQAITISPNSGRALNNYGTFLCRQKEYAKSEKYLIAAANEKDYIDSAAAYENAGLCALEIPSIAKAEKYFEAALRQDPSRATSYFELAKIYYQQKKYKLAYRYVQGYKSAGSSNPQVLWLGIKIAMELNDTSTILKDGMELQKNFPTSKQAKMYQKINLS